jgi:nucleoside-diphosphate-sugar epimerase
LLAFHAAGGQRAVCAGSCAKYDWDHPVAVEGRTPLRPTTLYGTAKAALGAIASKFAANQGLGLAWGRLYLPYGPHEHPDRLVPSVIHALLAGEPALCTHGEQVRDFVYVDDAAAAFAALLDSQVTGAVNVASGEPHRLKEVVACIAETLGRPDLIRLGARRAPANDVPVLTADVTRLRKEVDCAPPLSLVTGIRKSVEWWVGQSAPDRVPTGASS